MDVPEIKPILLTPAETDLRKQTDADFSRNSGYSGKVAHSLLKALSARNAFQRSGFGFSLIRFRAGAENPIRMCLKEMVVVEMPFLSIRILCAISAILW